MTALNNDLSEKAILLLKVAYRDYAYGSVAGAGLTRTIVVHARLGRQSSADSRRESCLFRMVSIVETYTDLMLDLALNHDLPSAGPVTTLLMQDALEAASTWSKRKIFGRRYAIPVNRFTKWSKIDAAIAARNTIAHGLGTVTRVHQVRAMQSKLSDIGISILDGRILIPDAALSDLRSVLVEYIQYVDGLRGSIEP